MPDDYHSKNSIKDLSIESLKTIALSLFLAFGIRVGVAESFLIPTPSMQPTLQIDDRLVVDKLSYRFHYPERGDIIAFQPTDQALSACGLPPDFRDAFIKRLIGLPGEQIEIKDGQVYVDGDMLPETYLAEEPDYQWGPMTVPSESYLLLGDNRNSSCDGHIWGFVPRDRLIGRAFIRFWPVDRIGAFSDHPTHPPIHPSTHPPFSPETIILTPSPSWSTPRPNLAVTHLPAPAPHHGGNVQP
ncbi:MAG: signal peptidase I [Leptolyngbyaceae cyanobacterium MO_188.B28]|nr:signal peptidase I [Leptolyngbyaceae cyanobacterium MO_188.B28]